MMFRFAFIILIFATYLKTMNAGRLNFSKNNDRKLNYTMSTTSTSSSIVEPTKTLFVTYSQTSGGFTTSTSTSQSTSVSGSSTTSTKTEIVKTSTSSYPIDGTSTTLTTVFPGATKQVVSGLVNKEDNVFKKLKKKHIRSPSSPKGRKHKMSNPTPSSPKGRKHKKSKSSPTKPAAPISPMFSPSLSYKKSKSSPTKLAAPISPMFSPSLSPSRGPTPIPALISSPTTIPTTIPSPIPSPIYYDDGYYYYDDDGYYYN